MEVIRAFLVPACGMRWGWTGKHRREWRLDGGKHYANISEAAPRKMKFVSIIVALVYVANVAASKPQVGTTWQYTRHRHELGEQVIENGFFTVIGESYEPPFYTTFVDSKDTEGGGKQLALKQDQLPIRWTQKEMDARTSRSNGETVYIFNPMTKHDNKIADFLLFWVSFAHAYVAYEAVGTINEQLTARERNQRFKVIILCFVIMATTGRAIFYNLRTFNALPGYPSRVYAFLLEMPTFAFHCAGALFLSAVVAEPQYGTVLFAICLVYMFVLAYLIMSNEFGDKRAYYRLSSCFTFATLVIYYYTDGLVARVKDALLNPTYTLKFSPESGSDEEDDHSKGVAIVTFALGAIVHFLSVAVFKITSQSWGGYLPVLLRTMEAYCFHHVWKLCRV
jgi:hypothetical protein